MIVQLIKIKLAVSVFALKHLLAVDLEIVLHSLFGKGD
jgi:hypothetical protein